MNTLRHVARCWRPLWGAVTLLAAPLAGQAPRASLYDRWQFSTAVTGVILNSSIRIDASDGSSGTTVDAEDDLGLATQKIEPRLAVRWRPGHRHELEFGYQFVRRSSDKVLERDIVFGDTTFRVGTTVNVKLNTDQGFVTYRYAVMAKPRSQAGLSASLGPIFFQTGLNGLTQGTQGNQVQINQSRSATGPVGSVGLYGRFLMGGRWSVEADARYVAATVDRFDAKVAEGGAAVRYLAWSKVIMEGGYGYSDINLDIAPRTTFTGGQGPLAGQLKYSLQQVRLAVVAIF